MERVHDMLTPKERWAQWKKHEEWHRQHFQLFYSWQVCRYMYTKIWHVQSTMISWHVYNTLKLQSHDGENHDLRITRSYVTRSRGASSIRLKHFTVQQEAKSQLGFSATLCLRCQSKNRVASSTLRSSVVWMLPAKWTDACDVADSSAIASVVQI